jgi:hypothetical protein
MEITKEQIESWIGGDNQNVNYYLDLLHELINEEYPIESFKKDVQDYVEYIILDN